MVFQLLHQTEEKKCLNLKNFILKIGKVVYKKSNKKVEVKLDKKVETNFHKENSWIAASSQQVKTQPH